VALAPPVGEVTFDGQWEHPGQPFKRDPRTEPYNPNAERYSKHAQLQTDSSVAPANVDAYPKMGMEQWKQCSTKWNSALLARSSRVKRQHDRTTRSMAQTMAPKKMGCTKIGMIEMKDAHRRATRKATIAAGRTSVQSNMKATEQAFCRVPDLRDQRGDEEVRSVNRALAPKRKVYAQPRRLQYTGYSEKAKKPLDSRGGCFAVAAGVQAQPDGTVTWNTSQARASLLFCDGVHPQAVSGDPGEMQTVYHYTGGGARPVRAWQARPMSACEFTEASRREAEDDARFKNTAKFGKCVVKKADLRDCIKRPLTAKNVRTWYW